jgi:hypothetical protein
MSDVEPRSASFFALSALAEHVKGKGDVRQSVRIRVPTCDTDE